MNPWDQIKKQLEASLSRENYSGVIGKTSYAELERGVLRINVPNEETRVWLETEYASQVNALIRKLALGIKAVVYDVAPPVEGATENGTEPMPDFESPASQLNPRFTFDNFVVGACNQFAHAAARSVATNPSRSYNPLFLYGGVGMGKTHLMHAIGRALINGSSRMRIVYTSSERFTNEVVSGIRFERMMQLRQRYRSADVLLIDDIQLLGNKERTQEEFFHTFNALYEQQKQIVISSDCLPKDINSIEERLRSRFEWGLIADIQPPDLETKIAILQKKADNDRFSLPDDVAEYIARAIKSNVRELEGALTRLMAYASLTGVTVSLSTAQQVLRNIIASQEKRVTIDLIQKRVSEHFNLREQDLKVRSNTRAIAFPRQVAMYIVKQLTTASLPEIGRQFGGKHHTTVLHSINKIEELRRNDKDLNRTITRLMDALQ
jgi:chromosomal replication initiator protein